MHRSIRAGGGLDDFEKKYPASILVQEKNLCTRPLLEKIHTFSEPKKIPANREKNIMHTHAPRKQIPCA